MTQIPLDNASVGSLCFRDDTLFALCSNGFMYRYDLFGQLLSQTELEVVSSFGSSILSPYTDFSALSWHFTKDNRLILNALSTANVIDCENWSVTAAISNFIMYEEEENALLCKLGGDIVGFTHLDTGMLLKKAEEALNGFCLTEQQKTAYGID